MKEFGRQYLQVYAKLRLDVCSNFTGQKNNILSNLYIFTMQAWQKHHIPSLEIYS